LRFFHTLHVSLRSLNGAYGEFGKHSWFSRLFRLELSAATTLNFAS